MRKIGRLYSSIIYQNVGVLITLGLIRVLFGDYGLYPNKDLLSIYNDMILYLVPVLLAYTGGRLFGNSRGGIAAAMTVFALALSSQAPMIIGAMLLGPLVGLIFAFAEKRLEKWIPPGFELFFGNLLVAIFGLTFMMISYKFLGGFLASIIHHILVIMETIVAEGWLPMTALIVEPLKVLFFNNVINHGFLVPIGIQEAKETGRSVFFLVEDNPGPGLGILLAYLIHSPKTMRKNTYLSAIIHFFGGIHEVYFPYVLKNPLLIFAAIGGGMAGNYIFELLNCGLVSVSSPASILFMIILSPHGSLLNNVIGIFLSALVSFLLALCLLQLSKRRTVHIENDKMLKSLGSAVPFSYAESEEAISEEAVPTRPIQTIVFACEAGMGSSALAAAMLRKHLKEHQLEITVSHCSVNAIPANAELIITHRQFYAMLKRDYADKTVIKINSFVDEREYHTVIQFLLDQQTEDTVDLHPHQVLLNAKAKDKEEAIRQVGQRMVDLGFAQSSYIDEMLEREKHFTTYIGKGLAVPHGMTESRQAVNKLGIVVAVFPEGVSFDGHDVFIAIGIASHGEEQVHLLSIIAQLLDEEEALETLKYATDYQTVIQILKKFGL
ncbi:PTS system mannitol-specific EIICBA component [Pullulanibacillus camelliae]|uniref:Mannitol-specific phosphotransferase enzyme IIA component n=1 Tax=Pullulanibacillus camelliae TaxID=1707096 RepID=A0A8J2VKZ3_9BACL|nr:PTS sugar transporter subunit IIA [Pullulanibacillus camelliae]GGE29578.1 PTS system mannitol-specific EIICBA component [Pullulanibacillus camelliae]